MLGQIKYMNVQPSCVVQLYFLVCIGLYTILYTHVAVNNVHLISERDDEISNFSPWSAQEEPQSHGNRSAKNHTQRNEVGNIAELFAKRKLDVCQEPGLFSADTAPASNIFFYFLSPVFFFTQNSPFKSSPNLPPPFKIFSPHMCAHSPPPPPFSRLPALRLWCWQIRSLRAACSSALMKEPVTRSTASLSTSSASYSTPLKRTGP